MKRRLQDMVVVITGASAGIGKELAIQLSAAGAKLVLAARRENLTNDLNRSLGGKHLVVPTNVAEARACEILIARSREHFGRIDTLVCNAGYGLAKKVHETSEIEMIAMFRTNVFGTTDCIRPVVPIMMKQSPRNGEKWRGQIMIVSSAAARRGLPFFGPYSATKSAQLGLSEALRVELKPHRIAVTSVHPVGTETEFFDVAQAGTGIDIGPPKAGEVRQSAAVVARKMIRAIEKPRPECWPFVPVKFALALNALMPRIGDKIMQKYRGQLDAKLDSAR